MSNLSIQAQLQEARIKMETLKRAVSDSQADYMKAKYEVERLVKKQIHLSQPLGVTDHALVRYMERVMDIDTEELRKELIAAVKEYHSTYGDGVFPYKGYEVVVKNNSIITIK